MLLYGEDVLKLVMWNYFAFRDSKKRVLEEGLYLHIETNTPCYVFPSNSSSTGWVRESGDLHVGIGALDKKYASGLVHITTEEAGILLNKVIVDKQFLSSKGIRQDPHGRLRIGA